MQENPLVFFEMQLGRYGDAVPLGRIVMELKKDVVPKTADNFLQLTQTEPGKGYALSRFHRIIPDFMCQGGDFTNDNGTGTLCLHRPFPQSCAALFKYHVHPAQHDLKHLATPIKAARNSSPAHAQPEATMHKHACHTALEKHNSPCLNRAGAHHIAVRVPCIGLQAGAASMATSLRTRTLS